MGNENVVRNENNEIKEGIGMAKKDRRIYIRKVEVHR